MRVSGSRLLVVLSLVGSLSILEWPAPAEACGCFTPPDPTVPIVQAGERILFAVKNGQVTSYVQIQYAGTAADFGWLLPLPSVPALELATDEVFTQLYSATQPQYKMTVSFDPACRPYFYGGAGGGTGTGGGAGGGPGGFADAGSSSPLVVQDSVGPYDYAVLKADSRDAMLAWLADNHYFVPVGTNDAVAPYIHSGGFFLALKLHSGSSTGDLQPIVLKYASDVGMIPITLTSTGAEQNMGVQVWMLGEGRAIPRNYHHTVLNDEAIDWPSSGSNYNDVIIRAVGEAPGKHTFVTEFAGASAVMKGKLAPQGRFGLQVDLATSPTPSEFVRYLYNHGFTVQGAVANGYGYGYQLPVLPGPLKAILAKYLPPPVGMSPEQFYRYFDGYGIQPGSSYQPIEMAAQIWLRVVEPTLAASALFDQLPYLTRLYTTISPADMTKDPVFSFNRELADVGNVHAATMKVSCDSVLGEERSAELVTAQGWHLRFPAGRYGRPEIDVTQVPASLRIEILREEGAPEVVIDNGTVAAHPPLVVPVGPQAPSCGCGATGPSAMLAALVPLALARLRRRPGGVVKKR